jgi:acyl-CoA synthetase (AMP-forming)/AMP-acid ligase II
MSAETFNACAYLVDRQVEAGLGDHPAVTGPAGSLTYAELAARAAECAVVARRNTAGLEVVACVVPAPGRSVDADALIAFCRDGLASFKRPHQVLALDALPKTATGKIQRVVVRELVAQRLGKPGK